MELGACVESRPATRRLLRLYDIHADGIKSIRKIAEELNRRGILTPRGGEWQPTTVVRLLARWEVT
jgi:Recombinase